jgi:hypothetical protein
MAGTIHITQYDPATKRYRAELVVVTGETETRYTCDGQWDPKFAAGTAELLKAEADKVAKNETEKAAIAAAIQAEFDKLEVAHD